jgi:hypothetical protein
MKIIKVSCQQTLGHCGQNCGLVCPQINTDGFIEAVREQLLAEMAAEAAAKKAAAESVIWSFT